jgi:serine/threonine-protein kinase RsbW
MQLPQIRFKKGFMTMSSGLWLLPHQSSCPSVTAPSDPRMLSVVRTFVEAVCQARQVDSTTINAVVLATGEAVTNIVRHAHRDTPDAPFQVQCRVGQDTVEITLLDQGAHFDVTQVPDLMRALMDEIICQPLGQRGNCLRLLKRWPSVSTVRDCG